MTGRLEGKTALITGAGSGMGRAAALLFAREGAAVGVLDRDAEAARGVTAEIGMAGGSAHALTADVADADAVRRAVEELVSACGRLDVVYNNAGVWMPGDGPVGELDVDAWDRTLAINLGGVFHTCRATLPHLIEAGGGSIINTSSPVAVRPEPVYDAYVASKGAVLSLTRSIAQHYAQFGVRANVIMPGNIDTPMTRPAMEADAAYTAHLVRTTPLNRIGRPEDVAYAALYLASDESSFVTGSTQWVDGGWLLGPQAEPVSAV
jgi:NAD(P)-dependent dehydrogenase (short-subunit alcohol dehydrogenase family)